MKLSYPKVRFVFHHPKNKEEFDKLFNQLNECRKMGDIDGVFTTAMQLIPTVVEEPKVGLYLIFVWGDVEPKIIGPFDTEDERNKKAREIRCEEGDRHGIFPLDISEESLPEIYSYSGAFFEEE